MTEKEELKAALQEELKSFRENLPSYVTQDDLTKQMDSFTEQMKELNVKEDLSELQKAVETQGLKLREYQEKGQEPETLKEQFEKNKDQIKAIASGHGKSHTMTIKTAAERSSITSDYRGVMLPGFGQIATPRQTIRGLFNIMPINMADSGGVVRWTDQSAVTRAAAARAESAAYPESALSWTGYSRTVEKIVDSIPASKELFRDVAAVQAEIENFVRLNLALKLDTDLYSGDGNTPNLKGIYTYADAYTAAAAGIVDASIYDLIVKVQEDIEASTQYTCNYAIMNIADINAMKLKKSTLNTYVIPPFVSKDGNVVNGITIIPSSRVTQDTMIVGDFNFARFYDAQEIQIEMGYVGNQFRDDLLTIKGSLFGLSLVRNVETNAFRKVTGIAAALVTLAS